MYEDVSMKERKYVAKGPIFELIKELTDDIKITNETRENIIAYLNEHVKKEISVLCEWFLDVSNLQGKRTIQEKEWEFILKKKSIK